jgi:hypothetical protein
MRNKQRHGCLTAWLIYLIVAYSIVSIVFFFHTDGIIEEFPNKTSENTILLIGSIGILNTLFCFLLFKWIKLGFWGMILTNLSMLIIQIINGYEISHSAFGIFCIITLYSLLQLKKIKFQVGII